MNKEINKKYFSKINCPKKCEFKNGTKGICFIPLPSKTFFILISRDPTINWYKNYYSKYNQIREVLFHSAIPQWLIERISNFVPLNKKEKEQLSYIINLKNAGKSNI